MDEPISKRAFHFLKKAGPKAFVRKCWLAARNRLASRPNQGRDRRDSEHYQQKLRNLTVSDGHVTVPVLDFHLRLRVDDLGLSRELIMHGIRERDAVEYLRPLLPGFRVILEIGANQGYYAILEARETPPEARIYAFEPHPDNVRTLRLNTELNGCADKFGEILQAAVSDRCGTAKLNVHGQSNLHSLSQSPVLGRWQKTLRVETVTLDEFCRGRGIAMVDFVRMDVEGHEAAIVDGAADILKTSPGCVMFIELHSGLIRESGGSPEAMLRQLKALGFASVTVCGRGRSLHNASMDHIIRNLELLTEEYGAHFFFFKKPANNK
jgi:FkbM family methyltransferase